jgi:F0F1-type ATP synthase alpha subunit
MPHGTFLGKSEKPPTASTPSLKNKRTSFNQELRSSLKTETARIVAELKEKKKISEEFGEKLGSVLDEFKGVFSAD